MLGYFQLPDRLRFPSDQQFTTGVPGCEHQKRSEEVHFPPLLPGAVDRTQLTPLLHHFCRGAGLCVGGTNISAWTIRSRMCV